jgi:hypothetical protein
LPKRPTKALNSVLFLIDLRRMEPEVRKFLTVLMQTISLVLLWMLLNTFFGIKLGYLFLEAPLTIWHGVYFLGMLASFVWLLRHIIKQWRTLPKFGGPNGN